LAYNSTARIHADSLRVWI